MLKDYALKDGLSKYKLFSSNKQIYTEKIFMINKDSYRK
jgi:hypothetical protein